MLLANSDVNDPVIALQGAHIDVTSPCGGEKTSRWCRCLSRLRTAIFGAFHVDTIRPVLAFRHSLCMLLLNMLLLYKNLPSIKLDKHGTIGLQFFDGYGETEIVQV